MDAHDHGKGENLAYAMNFFHPMSMVPAFLGSDLNAHWLWVAL
jgi:hypothetical protein